MRYISPLYMCHWYSGHLSCCLGNPYPRCCRESGVKHLTSHLFFYFCNMCFCVYHTTLIENHVYFYIYVSMIYELLLCVTYDDQVFNIDPAIWTEQDLRFVYTAHFDLRNIFQIMWFSLKDKRTISICGIVVQLTSQNQFYKKSLW